MQREQVRELQLERKQHRRELAALTEELKVRDSTVQSLTEQLYSISHLNSPTQKTLTQTQPPSEAPTILQDITSSQPTPSIAPSSHRKPPFPTSMDTPSTKQTLPSAPSSRREQPPSAASPNTQTTTSRLSSTEPLTHEEDAGTTQEDEKPEQTDIVLLIDSNGKFINMRKLFPNHHAIKVWCPTTQKALELLSETQLGSPSHILIHTGTNDLRTQQDGVVDSLRAVIQKASDTFPQSKIVISTLLPRTDVHPLTIQKVNASISRECALRPNVHLAHHSTMSTNHLYDHVHLHKYVVPAFARTLKDAAFTRNAPLRSYNRGHQNSPRPVRRHPHHQPHPGPQRRTQERSAPATTQPTAPRPMHAQPHNAAPPPQHLQPLPGTPTYAQALSGTGSPASNELRDIQQMLGLICARLLSNGSW